LKAHVAPEGSPVQLKVTVPVKPFCGAMVTVLVVLLPADMLAGLNTAGERFKSFTRIFTDRAQCTGHHKGAMLYAAVVPLSGRTTSRELATKLGREPQPGLYSTSASSFALPRSTPLREPSPQPGAGILACFPIGTLDRAPKHPSISEKRH
jgi:hypothetical protein